jgi:hypothetical protein
MGNAIVSIHHYQDYNIPAQLVTVALITTRASIQPTHSLNAATMDDVNVEHAYAMKVTLENSVKLASILMCVRLHRVKPTGYVLSAAQE